MRKRCSIMGCIGFLLLILCLLVPSVKVRASSDFNLIQAVDQKAVRYGWWSEDENGKRYNYTNGGYPRQVWLKIEGKYYYFDKEGYVKTGWVSFKQNRYFLSRRAGRTGELLLGKQKIDGNTYYFPKTTAIMAKGWTKIGSSWYYFGQSSGKMIKNRWIDGRYLKADGTMAVNTWVGGKYVGANGYVTAPPEDKKEARLIFVGDSRTVGLKSTIGGGKNLYIAKSSQGYVWFSKTAVKTLKKRLESYPYSTVVFNFGVNDVDNVYAYIGLYKKLIGEYPNAKFYIMSVNPIQSKKGSWYVTNKMIRSFNSIMKAAFPDRYLDCYEELKQKGFQTVDGLHYNQATYRKIYAFAVRETSWK